MRFIFSIFANPHAEAEIWLTEGPMFNRSIAQPMICRSGLRGRIIQKLQSHVYFSQIIKDPRANRIVYTSGFPGGIFKSTDGGGCWHEANFGMVSFDVEDPLRQGYYAPAISPSEPEVLYLGLYGKGVYRSVNGAATWYPVNGAAREMANKYITALVIDSRDSAKVYMATEDGIYRTRDGGDTWFSIMSGTDGNNVTRCLLLSADGKLPYFGSAGAVVFRRERHW